MKIKVMQLIHLAYCSSILIFTGVVLFVNKETLKLDFNLKNIEPGEIVAPIMAAICLLIAPVFFNKIIQGLDENSDVDTKITKYQSAFIIKFALLEGAALFNVVMCLKTANVFFLFFTAFIFFAMWMGKPTLDKVSSALNLQNSDLN